MQRLPLSTLRSLLTTPTNSFRPAASRLFQLPKGPNTAKSFSTNFGRKPGVVLDALKNHKAKWGATTGIFARGSSRTLMTDRTMIQRSEFSWQKLAWTAAGVAGTVLVVDTIFNRDTRDPLTHGEQEYLNSSFKYTGVGVVLTALAARTLFKSGAAFRIMSANPWLVLGVSLVGSIGSMMGTYYTPPERTVQKHLFWLAFNGFQAATLSPLFFLNPAILSRAALYTVGMVGSLSYIGATATTDRYLYLGGPLLAGVTIVALSSIAPMVLPMGLRALALTESISIYGGLAVFGGFVLYDTQKILKHGRMTEQGLMKGDPMNEAISLELDILNIFIRMVQILSMQNNRRK